MLTKKLRHAFTCFRRAVDRKRGPGSSIALSEKGLTIAMGDGTHLNLKENLVMQVLGVAARSARINERRVTAVLRSVTSFPVMLGVLLLGAVFIATFSFTLDPDVWWHVKVGETILQTRRWPTVDTYSFTASGAPCIYNQWLGSVLLAISVRLGGLQGLEGFQILLGGAILVALYLYGTIRSGNSKAGFVASAVLLVLSACFFSMRPQMLSFLFLVLTLIVLERFRQGKTRTLWLLPLMFVVWVNTHAFFLIGLGLIGLYWASGVVEFRLGDIETRRWRPEERQRLELVFLLSLISLTITPYGTRLAALAFSLGTESHSFTDAILEWQPMAFNLLGGKIFLATVLGLILVQATLRLTWRLEEFVLVLGGIMMACLHLRYLLIFVPFFMPVISTVLARWVPPYDRAKDKHALNAFLIIFVIGVVVWYSPSQADLEQKVALQYPVHAVDYLRQHPVPGPMYNTYGMGGYLVGALGPEHKVFIDGRVGPYEETGVLADYMHISQVKPGALAVLNGYRVQSCLIRSGEPLATLLEVSSEWQRVYQDKLSVLYVRRRTDAQVAPKADNH